MKQLRILYFSSTGNTKRAVGIIGDSCAAAGISVETLGLFEEDALRISGDADSETLIAFPALGFGAPNMVQARLRGFPEGEGTVVRVLIVCGSTYGAGRFVRGWPGQALEQVEAILARKGYVVASTAFISYPVNWTQTSSPHSGAILETMLAAGDAEAREFAAAMIGGDARRYRCGAFNRLWSGAVNFLFRSVGRRFLGKCYQADASCTGCGLCAKSCPSRSIAMRGGKPAWKASCEDCNRCINICPTASIQVSVFKAVAYIGLSLAGTAAAIAVGARLRASILPGLGGIASALLVLAFVIALTPPVIALILGPIDALVGLAARVPALGRLISKGYTSKYGRYKEPGFKP